MKYRPEIDGLRAVAVMPVILFHGGFQWFSGGFVGVDVFFVISGYLITSILISDLEQGRFSISQFYERRARRIIPALFAVMLACIPFAYLWMLPSQLEDFAESIVAVILFASNVLFWQEAGYFAPAAELKPLLHTWSLAVEEQYYLLFPLLLALLWKIKRKSSLLIITILAALSFALAEWASRAAPGANFYLAPTRAWELLAGSICALVATGQAQRSNNALSALGLSLIVASIFIYDANTPFPSFYTLAPVAGTSLIILYASQETWTAKLLSFKAFVGIGLISYSAYLWHQPLFAFARLRSLNEPNIAIMGVLSCLSLALAWLSWEYVERPFRFGKSSVLPTRKTVFTATAISSAFFVAVGLTGIINHGFPSRNVGNVSYLNLEARIAPNYGLHSDCDGGFNTSPNCYTSQTPTALLWGDSFAMHLVQGVQASAESLALQQHTMSSCAPILGIAQLGSGKTEGWARSCIAFNNQVLQWLSENPTVETVILSSPFEQLINNKIYATGGTTYSLNSIDIIVKKTRLTVEKIRDTGAKVIIVSPPPKSAHDIGQCLVKSIMFHSDTSQCNFESGINVSAIDMLKTVEAFAPVHWLEKEICTDDRCLASKFDRFIFRDDKHLSIEGSAYLGSIGGWMDRFASAAN